MVCLSESLNPPERSTNMRTIEVHLPDQEYYRIKLISLGWNESMSELFRNSVNRDIEAGLYNEELTGLEYPGHIG